MQYWISTICLFVIIAVIGLVLWKKGIKDDDMEPDTFKTLIVLGCILLLVFIPFAADLPSALSGGQEIYVNELPTRYIIGTHISYVKTDNKQLKHFKLGEWEKYEKYGNYRIKYTKHFKFVLAIDSVE